jgi:hypothetical protein
MNLLDDTQAKILCDMTERLEMDVLCEVDRIIKKELNSHRPVLLKDSLPLSLLVRVALENLAEKHPISSAHKATYTYLKKL